MSRLSRPAIVIPTTYLVAGSLWVFSSFQYVRDSLTDPAQIQLLFNQTLLRSLFILFSTVLLFILIRFYTRKLETASEQHLRLFEENPHPMWVFDQETLRFLAVNNATIKKYGFSRSEFLKMTIKEIRPTDQVNRLLNERIVLTSGFLAAGVWQHQTKTGKLLDVEISTHFLQFDGRKAELVMAHDVTERLKHEREIMELTNTLERRVNERTHDLHEALQEQAALTEELETNNEELMITNERLIEAQETIQTQARKLVLTSEDKLNMVVSNVKDFIWSAKFKDHQFAVDLMSPAVEEIMGFTEPEYTKNPLIWLDVVVDEDKSISTNFLANVSAAPYHELHYRIVHPRSRQIRHLQSRIWVSESPEEGAVQLNGIVSDITERKLQEEERSRLLTQLVLQNNDLIQFSYIASHNLRGPLASLMGLLQLIDSQNEADQKTMHQHLRSSVNKLDDVIKDITKVLDIRDHQSSPKEWVDLADLIRDIREILGQQIDDSRAIVEYSASGDTRIFTVKGYLHSIVYNLIANAIKYRAPDRSPTIKIRSMFTETVLKISIADNGLGIDMARYSDKIFNLYKRFHTHVEGKGMGLYLVKTQVTALGGTITIQSEVGAGTLFIITFPKNAIQEEVN